MKKLLFILIFGIIVPLNAATIYMHTDRNALHIVIYPLVYGEIFNPWGYGIHSGLGPNSGRTVNHYYPMYFAPTDRPERIMNNSGTGAHGPGTY